MKAKQSLVYISVVFCAILFYSHKFIQPYSNDYWSKLKEHEKLKKERTIALSRVKDYAKGTVYYEDYKRIRDKTNEAWSVFKRAEENEKIYGFNSVHYFIERLGLTVLIFIYSLYNLFRSFYYERRNMASKVFHGFVISVAMFYFFWIFSVFQDFSKVTYLIMTLFSASLVVTGVYFFTRYKESYINKLKGNVREISKFTIKNTKPEKQAEMFEVLEKIAKTN
ncbi:hypothetical protein [Tenacibaculum sp. 190524A02b]